MEPTIDKIDRLIIELFGGEVIAQGEISNENEEEFFGERLDEEQKEHKRIFEHIRFNQELHTQRENIVTIERIMEVQMNELESKQAELQELQAKLQATDNATDILFDVIGIEEEAKKEIKAKDKIEPEPPPQQALAVEAPPTPTAATANATNQIAIINKSINDNIAQYQEEFKLFKVGSIYRTAKNRDILYNFIAANGVNFLVGAGGSGKTYLCYHLIIDLLRQNYNVFYVDLDNTDELFIERGFSDKVVRIGKGDYIRYFNNQDYEISTNDDELKALKIKDEFDFATKTIKTIIKYKQRFSEQNVVVFIDSLHNLIDDFSIERMSNIFMRFLRRTARKGLTLIVLHHTAKANNQFKGFTVIRDAADMMYTIAKTQRDAFGNVTDYILKVEKNRYSAPEQLQIKILGDYEFKTVNTVLDLDENTVLKIAYFALLKNKEMQKMQLNQHIRDKLIGIGQKIGRIKVGEILDKFIELRLFNIRQGDKAAVYLSLNMQNDTLIKLTEEFTDEY